MIRRTYGSVKEQLARVTQNGMCASDPQLLARTNEAQERLLNKGLYVGTYGRYSVCVYGGCITLPREFDSIVGYNYSGAPAQVYNQWYEFMANGPGIAPAGAWRQLIDRGYVATFRGIESQKYLRVYTDLIEDANTTILFRGSDTFNNRVVTQENGQYIDGERLSLSAGSGNSSVLLNFLSSTGAPEGSGGIYVWVGIQENRPKYRNNNGWTIGAALFAGSFYQWEIRDATGNLSAYTEEVSPLSNYPWLGGTFFGGNYSATASERPRTTVNAFCSIDAINKTPTKGWVRVYALDPVTGSESNIAILAPDETLPQYRSYAIPGHESEEGATVTVLAKRKFIPVKSDDDDLIVTNLGALKMMAIAIEKEENNNLEEAMQYEEKAVQLLREELKESEGANIGRPQVQMEAFAMGEVPAMA
jgi:hypothetical protein